MDVSVLEASDLIIHKIDDLEEHDRKLIINHVWTRHIIGIATRISAENSIIKEIESIEENQRMKIIQHVYLTWIKPILEQVDLSDAYCEEDNIYEICDTDVDKEKSSASVLIKLIDNLRNIVLEYEMSEDDDEIEERRIQAGVTLENVKQLLNGQPIAEYDSEKQQAYFLYPDLTRKYLYDYEEENGGSK